MGCCTNAQNEAMRGIPKIQKAKETGVLGFEVNDVEGYTMGTIGSHTHGMKALLFVNVASF